MSTIKPKDGTYSAITGGYNSEFSDGVHKFRAKFLNGIRTPRTSDTISVNDGIVTSRYLGKAVELVVLTEVKLS